MVIKMNFGALTLFLHLGASSLVFAGPSAPHLPINEELEAQVTNLDPEQLEAVSSGLAELGKSGGVPRVLTLLEKTVTGDQELELAKSQGKTGLQTTLPRDCGRNPRYARTGGQKDNAPWLLLMGKGRGKDFQPSCIGIAISSRHLVANAICVFTNEVDAVLSALPNGEPRLFEVLRRNVAGDVENVGDFLVGRNLVLVTLKSPLSFSEYTQPACLPSLSTSANLQGQIRGATIYGIQITNGNLNKFTVPVDAYGPAVFYSLLKQFNTENPRELVRSVELVATKHLGVVANFKQVKNSALILLDKEDGRFYLVGVGPVASDLEEPVALYTSVVPHRHWIEGALRQ